MSAREFGRQMLRRALAGPPAIDPLAVARARADISSLTLSLKRAIDERNEARERAERHRLAWTSARRRARRYDDRADELDERATRHHGMYEQARDLAVRLERERDLAVAHDRQPYPTADAYEHACAALHEHRAAEERYRLAWTSARQRAANHLAALIDADEERDGLRAEVVRLGKRLQKFEDKFGANAAELLEGIAEVFGCPTCRTVLRPRAVPGGCADMWHFDNQYRDDELDAATARLRAALDEERIEPKGANGHGKWCASLHAPPGQTYACDCNEVGAG